MCANTRQLFPQIIFVFSNKILLKQASVDFSSIQTWILGVEGVNIDHQTIIPFT